MEGYIYVAVILLVVNLVITTIAYFIEKRNKENVSYFLIFFTTNLCVTLISGFLLLLVHFLSYNMGTAIILVLYAIYVLPVSVLFIIISLVLHYNYKKKQDNIE